MNKRERLLLAIGEADEKYIKEAESKMNVMSIIKVAALLLVVTALSLYLFIPFAPVTSNLKVYEDSSYFPLIEGIDEYRLSFMQPKYKNNFEGIVATLDGMFSISKGGAMDNNNAGADMAPGASGDMEESIMGNGSYVESTDNQVNGVIESDLFKMTDKYIFRLGYGYEFIEYEDEKGPTVEQLTVVVLRVYSIDKDNSTLVAEYKLPRFENEFFKDYDDGEMYLSLDGKTVTFIKTYTDENTNLSKVGIISLDVSDVKNISTKAMVSIDGYYNTSRMVDGKLLLVTDYTFNRNKVEYDDPATFVPTIDRGNGAEPVEFEDIIYPAEINNTQYSVVAMLDSEDLSSMGEVALLNFTNQVYVSANNLYISREYVAKTEDQDGRVTTSNTSDIAVINYSGESLEKKGIITVRGWTEDQYSFDEKDGYLRVVTSTSDRTQTTNGSNVSVLPTSENVSLYVFDLATNSLAYKVEDFAIQGEEATAVRFDGDKCYVCTAVVVTFTDPVYFFDLSDYENIGSVDTGVIEGYSDHLINYGEGFLLGIGREDWEYSKVEIYEQIDDSVVGTMEYKFQGDYATEYKSYLVNREENIFGFGVNYFYKYDEQTGYGKSYQCYVLLRFDENGLVSREIELKSNVRADNIRAAYIDGYLYITTPYELIVEKID